MVNSRKLSLVEFSNRAREKLETMGGKEKWKQNTLVKN